LFSQLFPRSFEHLLLACQAIVGLVILTQRYESGGRESGEANRATLDWWRRTFEELASVLEESWAVVCSGSKCEGASGLRREEGKRVGLLWQGVFRAGATKEQRGAHGDFLVSSYRIVRASMSCVVYVRVNVKVMVVVVESLPPRR
jgi:hypothetical protein